MQLFGGPMDGAHVDELHLEPCGSVMRRGIRPKQITLGDGVVTIPVWIWADTDPTANVTYRRDAAGKFRHFHTERLR